MSDLLFVYGTLRRACPTGAHQKYLANAEFVDKGSVRGLLYRVSYYPALVLDQTGDPVIGEIYRLCDSHQLARLDAYEECTYPALPGQEYQRCLVEVESGQGKRYSAWVYTYLRSLASLPLIASGDFLKP